MISDSDSWAFLHYRYSLKSWIKPVRCWTRNFYWSFATVLSI